jgi:hypothetical protein
MGGIGTLVAVGWAVAVGWVVAVGAVVEEGRTTGVPVEPADSGVDAPGVQPMTAIKRLVRVNTVNIFLAGIIDLIDFLRIDLVQVRTPHKLSKGNMGQFNY